MYMHTEEAFSFISWLAYRHRYIQRNPLVHGNDRSRYQKYVLLLNVNYFNIGFT